ncbi:pGP6-D family virulence protein [bacterium]|nr:pGP6-D family virulence protein [bacterium]
MKLSEKIKRTITGRDRVEEGAIELQHVSNRLMADAGKRLLSDHEKGALKSLLSQSNDEITSISEDFTTLANITGEIKSIHHQSVLLHGERILQAQQLFKKYGEYAFSRWLKTVYGNRQTPYNFLKYYQFYISLSNPLQQKVLSMPKQIIYTIASRNCSNEDKHRVIESYEGESKDTYIKAIRKAFPLEKKDRREKKKEKTSAQILYLLGAAIEATESYKGDLSLEELREIDFKLKEFTSMLWQD